MKQILLISALTSVLLLSIVAPVFAADVTEVIPGISETKDNAVRQQQIQMQNQSGVLNPVNINAPSLSKLSGAPEINQEIQTVSQHLDTLKVQKEKDVLAYDHIKNCAPDQHTSTNYKTYLTHFACGHVSVLDNGTTLRKFTLIANDFNGSGKPVVISTDVRGLGKPSQEGQYMPVIFHAWTMNGTVPAPTLRVTVGDHVQLTLINSKESVFPHSLHMHSMHPGIMDGMSGAAGMVEPGHQFIYNFTAGPVGNYPYHCHMFPVEEHISRGLYGMLIIDPVTPRPPAIEMVGTLNSYTFSYEGLNGSGHFDTTRAVPATMQQMKANLSNVIATSDEGNGPDNQFYSINGMPFGYIGPNAIHLQTHQEYRMYLLNMVEFDPVNSFHIHGTLGTFTESSTLNSSKIYTDIVLLQQGDRGMFEFSYPYAGQFMFHSHINHFSDLGWTAFFSVSTKPGPLFTNMNP